MNPLLLMLFSLLVADPKMPCGVHVIKLGNLPPAPSFVCVLFAPLPDADASAVPPELAPLLKKSGETDAAPQTAPTPPAAPDDSAPEPHHEAPAADLPRGWYRASFGG